VPRSAAHARQLQGTRALDEPEPCPDDLMGLLSNRPVQDARFGVMLSSERSVEGCHAHRENQRPGQPEQGHGRHMSCVLHPEAHEGGSQSKGQAPQDCWREHALASARQTRLVRRAATVTAVWRAAWWAVLLVHRSNKSQK
jgi:hypothetical protein